MTPIYTYINMHMHIYIYIYTYIVLYYSLLCYDITCYDDILMYNTLWSRRKSGAVTTASLRICLKKIYIWMHNGISSYIWVLFSYTFIAYFLMICAVQSVHMDVYESYLPLYLRVQAAQSFSPPDVCSSENNRGDIYYRRGLDWVGSKN